MRVVLLASPRASRTGTSLGGRRVRQSAFRLCIAGEVLQIAESTEKKLSANPKSEHLSADKAKAVLAEPPSLADTIPELLRWQGRN